jgi:N-acetyl-anhydromuramyl-L-alanine amidase AmpD
MKVSPARLQKALDRYEVDYKLVPGWDSAKIDPYNGRSDFVGVILHHTAGTNSLNYIVNGNPYAPVRACHFLVDRDGTVRVVSGVGAYHAGVGGPWQITNSVTVPRDGGNSRTYGIEIESLGTSPLVNGKPGGMTVEQIVSTVRLNVALLDAMRPTWGLLYKAGRVIRHRDWANGRKVDTKQTLEWWQAVTNIGIRNRKNPQALEIAVRTFVKDHPKGVL